VEPQRGPALGLGGGVWPVESFALPEGVGLILLTDGLFEGHSGSGNDRLGEDGLLEIARGLSALEAGDFVEALIVGAERRASQHGGLTDDVFLRWCALHARLTCSAPGPPVSASRGADADASNLDRGRTHGRFRSATVRSAVDRLQNTY
jgi:hypothetical protein